jgi:integrase
MAVRITKRRGKRRLIIDIRYTKPDGSPGRYRKDAEVQTLAAARAEERRRLAALALTGSPSTRVDETSDTPDPSTGSTHRLQTTPKPSLAEVVEGCYRTFAQTSLKPSTRRGYEAVLKGFVLPRIGDRPINMIDAACMRSLDAEMVERGAKAGTRRQMQAVLRSVLCKHAVETGLLDEPPRFPKLPKSGRKIMHTLTDEELERLISVSQPRHQLVFMLAAFAGLRSGEVRGLRWRDVDLKAGELIVRQSICHGVAAAPKSGHERVIPLTSDLRTALNQCKRKERESPVALNSRGGTWTEYSLVNAFRRASGRAGLNGWRFHDLRHYFVTALFRAGVPAPTVQALAGHSNLATTQYYAHVERRDLAEAIARLEGKDAGNNGVTDPDES